MICDKCGGQIEIGSFPFCKGRPEDHGRGQATVIGDEMDWVQTNGCKTPIRFTSKSDRRAWLKAQGLEECVRHVENPATGHSTHTTDWSKMTDPYTAANVRELMERAFKQRPDKPIDNEIHFRPFDAQDLDALDKQFNSRH